MAGMVAAVGALRPKKIGRWLFFFALLFWLAWGSKRGLWEWARLSWEKRKIEREIEEYQQALSRMESEYQAYGSDRMLVEKRAREDLNLVYPNERLYKFKTSE